MAWLSTCQSMLSVVTSSYASLSCRYSRYDDALRMVSATLHVMMLSSIMRVAGGLGPLYWVVTIVSISVGWRVEDNGKFSSFNRGWAHFGDGAVA